jgi:hypothetical protein
MEARVSPDQVAHRSLLRSLQVAIHGHNDDDVAQGRAFCACQLEAWDIIDGPLSDPAVVYELPLVKPLRRVVREAISGSDRSLRAAVAALPASVRDYIEGQS